MLRIVREMIFEDKTGKRCIQALSEMNRDQTASAYIEESERCELDLANPWAEKPVNNGRSLHT